jgi:hypothetical protein
MGTRNELELEEPETAIAGLQSELLVFSSVTS